MTAPTPEQLRALAANEPLSGELGAYLSDVRTALRAAADQLEAVQRLRKAYAAFTASGGSSDV